MIFLAFPRPSPITFPMVHLLVRRKALVSMLENILPNHQDSWNSLPRHLDSFIYTPDSNEAYLFTYINTT